MVVVEPHQKVGRSSIRRDSDVTSKAVAVYYHMSECGIVDLVVSTLSPYEQVG